MKYDIVQSRSEDYMGPLTIYILPPIIFGTVGF